MLRLFRLFAFAAAPLCGVAGAAQPAEPNFTLAEVESAMRPYEGPIVQPIARDSLRGKVVAGYQGWFTAPGDGSGQGWRHYSKQGKFEPGQCSIDLWPDVSELSDAEKVVTPFRHADGSRAFVFSSHNRDTVLRHFRWMQDYELDGVFVQRFVVATRGPRDLRHCNTVLAHCREGANRYGRVYAVMYDLSGLQAGGTQYLIDDWKQLVDRMRLGRDEADKAYLRHDGKPVVAVWGVGFNDDRGYTLAECDKLLDFLRSDPRYGGNTLLVGVPTGWRTLDRDAVKETALHEVLRHADIVSPWTVGRYHSPETAARHAERDWKADLAHCREQKQDYLPVVFPGFSWHNMRPESPSNVIPRLKGEFLRSQFIAAKRAGAEMIYVAMFDELDEGTAIFKCTNDPPIGTSTFIDYEGLPSDAYLRLIGRAGRHLRGEITDLPASR